MSGNPLRDLDPAVLASLSDADHRDEARKRTSTQRKQAARDRERVKATIDFTGEEWLWEDIRAIAAAEDAGISSVVCWLLAMGLEARAAGREPKKDLSRSLRYSFEFVVPKRSRGAGQR